MTDLIDRYSRLDEAYAAVAAEAFSSEDLGLA